MECQPGYEGIDISAKSFYKCFTSVTIAMQKRTMNDNCNKYILYIN